MQKVHKPLNVISAHASDSCQRNPLLTHLTVLHYIFSQNISPVCRPLLFELLYKHVLTPRFCGVRERLLILIYVFEGKWVNLSSTANMV